MGKPDFWPVYSLQYAADEDVMGEPYWLDYAKWFTGDGEEAVGMCNQMSYMEPTCRWRIVLTTRSVYQPKALTDTQK